MTPPTQQDKPIDLEALRLAAEKLKRVAQTTDKRIFNTALLNFEDHATAANILALLALIDAQQKKIAALEGVAGFAADLGMPADGIGG